MTTPRPRHGFTLVEMLLALAVSAIALVAAIAAANAQQRAYYNGQKFRAAQNAGRAALLYLEQKLPMAGFGMDPALMLDLGWYDGPCPTDMDPCVRDSVSQPDELVFYARDPRYWVPTTASGEPKGRAWHLAGLDATEVTVKARVGDVFKKGQILQLVCSGEMRYAYFTVSDTTTVDTAGDVTVPLEAVDTADPFKRQDVGAGLSCVTTGGRLFLVDRYRFHVRPVAVGGGHDPFLVLDTGTDNDLDEDVDEADEVLIAEGIEGFQVAYVFHAPSLDPAGIGTTQLTINTTAAADDTADEITMTAFPGTVPAGGFEYAPSSFYSHGLLSPLPAARLTNHQANVRTVKLALVARSPEPDPATRSNLPWEAPEGPVQQRLYKFNQTARPTWVPADGGYQRVHLETSVTLPNHGLRAMSYF